MPSMGLRRFLDHGSLVRLAAAVSVLLDRRTRHRTIRAEHAAVPGDGLKTGPAALAVVKELACVDRHRFDGLMAAVGASEDGCQKPLATTWIPIRMIRLAKSGRFPAALAATSWFTQW